MLVCKQMQSVIMWNLYLLTLLAELWGGWEKRWGFTTNNQPSKSFLDKHQCSYNVVYVCGPYN